MVLIINLYFFWPVINLYLITGVQLIIHALSLIENLSFDLSLKKNLSSIPLKEPSKAYEISQSPIKVKCSNYSNYYYT